MVTAVSKRHHIMSSLEIPLSCNNRLAVVVSPSCIRRKTGTGIKGKMSVYGAKIGQIYRIENLRKKNYQRELVMKVIR